MLHLAHITLYGYAYILGLYPMVALPIVGLFLACILSVLDNRVWRTTGKLTEYSQPDPHDQLLLDTCTIIPAIAMGNNDSMVHPKLSDLQP